MERTFVVAQPVASVLRYFQAFTGDVSAKPGTLLRAINDEMEAAGVTRTLDHYKADSSFGQVISQGDDVIGWALYTVRASDDPNVTEIHRSAKGSQALKDVMDRAIAKSGVAPADVHAVMVTENNGWAERFGAFIAAHQVAGSAVSRGGVA